jgi:hypothetical protein
MKTVFNGAEIFHEFSRALADGENRAARNSSGSLSFNGAKFKSYDEVVGVVVGGTLVYTTQDFSPTTNRHISNLRSALSHYKQSPVITLKGYTEGVYAYRWIEEINERLRVANSNCEYVITNPKRRTKTKVEALEAFTILCADTRQVVAFVIASHTGGGSSKDSFKIAYERLQASKPFEEFALGGDIQEAVTKAVEAKRLREIALREAEALKEAKALADFKAGTQNSSWWSTGPYTYLRLQQQAHMGDFYTRDATPPPSWVVYTSKGVTIPLEDFKRFAEALEVGRAFGCEVNGFTVTQVDALSVTAGCHTVLRTEIMEIVGEIRSLERGIE